MIHLITGKTNVFGIIGDPVAHSLSPAMHNAAFKKLGLDNIYVPFRVKKEGLEAAVEGASAMGIKGLNVTIPHKKEVIEYLDYLDIAAGLIGAVNTIEFGENGVIGHNTDGIGAVRAIEEVTSIKDKKILILGAGGAARAISFQILLSGAEELIIANRTLKKASELKEDLVEKLDPNVKITDLGFPLQEELKNTDILINTTPIGMYPNLNQKPIVDASMMHKELIVNDIVYNPMKTGLMEEAEKAGAQLVYGVKMLMYQGIESFKIWTGIEPPIELFEEALMGELSIK